MASSNTEQQAGQILALLDEGSSLDSIATETALVVPSEEGIFEDHGMAT